MEPSAYYQLLWEHGLAALPAPGDLPNYLKPERIQKSLAAGLAKLLHFPESKIDAEGAAPDGVGLDIETVIERLGEMADWHLADHNRSLVKGFVRENSGAAVEFAAFAAGVAQASGLAPAFSVALNTVWVALTDPLAGGVTEAALEVAERLDCGAERSAR